MGESISRHYSKSQVMLLILTCGMGYTSMVFGGRIPQVYYNIFAGATGFSAAQIGLFLSLNGAVSLVGYFVSGVLSDIFSVKKLLVISYLGSAAGVFCLALLPSFTISCVLTCAVAVTSVLMYWASMAKFVRSLGGRDQEGRLYGLLYMAAGIGGAVVGLLGALITARVDDAAALRIIYYCYVAILIVAAVVVMKFYEDPVCDDSDKFQFKYILQLLKMPRMWLLSLGIGTGYLMCLGMAYYGPLLETAFGVSLTAVTAISAVRTYVIRVAATPVSGALIDKLKSSTKVVLMVLGTMLAIMVVLLILPWDSRFAIVAIVLVLLTAIIYNFLSPTWFSSVTELNVPDVMRGTAVGLLDAIVFSADCFSYVLAGSVVSAYGMTGYRYIYIVLAIAAAVGFILIVIFRRLSAKENATAAEQGIANTH